MKTKIILTLGLASAVMALLISCKLPEAKLSSEKAITSFSFPVVGATGTIDEGSHTIAVTVPYGTSVTNLVATFTTTGQSVKVGSTVQTSGVTANDFTSTVTYTVSAEDGSTQDYAVTVVIAASTAKAITAFSFPAVSATGPVDEINHTIAVTVPYGTSVTNLVATFTTTGQTVKVGSTVQTSGVTANNFSSAVTYTVVAADSSTQNYVVTVTPEPAPQMLVQIEGPTDVPSGTGVVIFGPINTRQTVSKTFWIYNKGPAGSYLRLTGGVQVSGTDAARFTPSYSFSSPIASNSYVTFTVVFSPDIYSAPKLCSASVSIASNDPTKNPYTFALKGNMWFRTYDVHGTTGTGSGQFSGPQAVAYNPVNSSVYVVDRMREKVLIFNSAGSFVSEFGPATGNGCLALPESVAIDSSGNVYVGSTAEQIDTGFHYVQKFDKDGNWLTGWGSYGTGNGQFAEVNGIAVGPGSEVYVSDRWNNRVEVFSSAGAYSRSWYVSEPLGIYVFSGGLVLVWTQSGIEEYDGTGTYQGDFGMGSYGPYLACDEFRDHVFATDNTSIRVYDFFGVLEGDLKCAGLFAAQIGGMAFGNGYLYFVNNDWGDPANYGNNALVRVQEYTAVP